MSVQTHGLRLRDVLTVGIAAGGLAYVALTWWFRREATLPPVSWLVAPFLLASAMALVAAGRAVRATVRAGRTGGTGRTDGADRPPARAPRRPVDPLTAYRILRLAQACALTGALVAGAYVAFAIVALPDADAASVRAAALTGVAVALSGAVLAGAGLWVQSMCRLDPTRRDLDDD